MYMYVEKFITIKLTIFSTAKLTYITSYIYITLIFIYVYNR